MDVIHFIVNSLVQVHATLNRTPTPISGVSWMNLLIGLLIMSISIGFITSLLKTQLASEKRTAVFGERIKKNKYHEISHDIRKE